MYRVTEVLLSLILDGTVEGLGIGASVGEGFGIRVATGYGIMLGETLDDNSEF